MSMTREEAIAVLAESKRQNEVMRDNPSTFWASHQMADGVKNAERRIAALDMALSALRPVSREQVENFWRGEWVIGEPDVLGVPIHCSRCGWGSDHADQRAWIEYKGHIFCGHCGAPMTDEAVDMMMERMEALHET